MNVSDEILDARLTGEHCPAMVRLPPGPLAERFTGWIEVSTIRDAIEACLDPERYAAERYQL